VNFEAMQQSVNALSEKILRLQGDGDYDGVTQLFTAMGEIGPSLRQDLDRLAEAGIPVDVVFEQGM
jgi:hypothetical protein